MLCGKTKAQVLFIVLKNYKNKKLNFSTDLNASIKKSDIIFICVGTPTKRSGTSADLSQIYNVAKEISSSVNKFKIIVKSKSIIRKLKISKLIL